jgi:His-Xaa-Ser system radical SAM maturase HxsC
MCSQPPRDIDDRWILDEISACLPLLDPTTEVIGFTGGEPLLEWRRFTALLSEIRDHLPAAKVHVLTNGRAFAREEVAAAWAGIKHPDLCPGIPIYSAVDHVHDYIVQSQGALNETVLGILRLKDKGQRVEVRVVLHRLTAARLVETCTWLARNMPFLDHVALMGMEDTGFALANHDELWIDPIDYARDLALGVDLLSTAGIQTSIYNLPLCILEPSIWSYAAKSISDWKNAHPSECEPCSQKPQCAGFFTTGRPKLSRAIRPILT